jgi:hypothetical protein
MSVKLVVLKTGENLITDIKEGIVNDKLVCYILEKPCRVYVNDSYRINGDEELELTNKVSISLENWPLFSSDDVLEMSCDSIITIVSPNGQLEKMYNTQILGESENETN